MSGQEMDQTIAQSVVPGKGILAADESAGTIGKRQVEQGMVPIAVRGQTAQHNTANTR